MSRDITLSPKYGLNPTILLCPVCGKETNELALVGRLKRDVEAPKYSFGNRMCDSCKEHVQQGHRFLIEVEEEEQSTSVPTRTGRYAIIVNPDVLPEVDQPIMYCPKSVFNQIPQPQNKENNEND